MNPGPFGLRFPLMAELVSIFHHDFPSLSVFTQNMSYVQVLSNSSGTFSNVWDINVLMSCDIGTCKTTNINNDWMMIKDKIPELIRFPVKGVKSQYLVFIWNWSTWFIDCMAFGNLFHFYFVFWFIIDFLHTKNRQLRPRKKSNVLQFIVLKMATVIYDCVKRCRKCWL